MLPSKGNAAKGDGRSHFASSHLQRGSASPEFDLGTDFSHLEGLVGQNSPHEFAGGTRYASDSNAADSYSRPPFGLFQSHMLSNDPYGKSINLFSFNMRARFPCLYICLVTLPQPKTRTTT